MKLLLFLLTFFISSLTFAESIDEVRVYKTQKKMDLLFMGKIVKSYKVMLGRGGKSAKQKQGDNRVPEGKYILDYKNPNSLFHKSLHISYPNDQDLRRANEMGVDPGGDIMIHGYPNKPKPLFTFLKKMGLIKLVNWTAGCVAVDNEEMDEIYANVEEHTPVTIFH